MYRNIKKLQTRSAIVEAATNEFKTQGFANTSIAEIMASAHLGVGTFYNYFASKEEVLMVIVKTLFRKVDEQVKLAAKDNPSSLELLELCCMSTARLIDENKFILPLIESAVRHSDIPEKFPPNISPDFKIIFERIITQGQLRGEIRNDIPINLISEMLHSIYQAAAFSKLKMPFQENIRLKVKILLDGIKK